MIPVILFLLSIGLQIAAAVVALVLIRTTGRKLAWLLLSFAIALMAWRRIVSFFSLLDSDKAMTFEFPEYIALVISALMLIGVLRIGAYFRSLQMKEAECKLAVVKLKESEERFKHVFDNAIDGILIADVETNKFMMANKMICRMLDYDEQEIKELRVQDIHPEDDLPYVLDQFDKQTRKEIVTAKDVPVKRKDGSIFYADINSSPVILSGRTYLIGMFRDITERKRSEKKIVYFNELMQYIIAHARSAIAVHDKDMKYIFVSEQYLKEYNVKEKDIIGKHHYDVFPDLPQKWRDVHKRVLAGAVEGNEEDPYYREDGSVDWTRWECRPWYESDGSIGGLIVYTEVITARKRAEDQIRALSLRLEAILAAVPDIIMEVDNNKVYTWANKAGLEFFGEDVIGKEAAFYFEGEQDTYALVEPIFKGTEEVFYVESWQRRKDGAKRLLAWWCRVVKDEDGNVKGALSTARDITEYRKLEEQLLQAKKMESIGTLAGGVAHDFNNILQTIIGYGSIALRTMEISDPQRQNIEYILEGATRASHLTKELLLFSRKQITDKKPVELNAIIRKNEKFLRRIIGEDIDFKTVLHEVLTILADSHQIEQVLMNLAANARDAMPKGGAFTVTTEQVTLKEDFISAHGFGKPGTYALITVSDTGSGINETAKERIFEPFFTTKEIGKGTGLGLAVVYGIIKQHDGFINVYSESDKGMTFRIYLPIIVSEIKEEAIAHNDKAPAHGTETVLVAEDDESLRKLSRTVLKEFGYTVIEAVDGEDAVKKFMENKENINILLFDLIMPKMTGKDAYNEIRKIRPDIKVIFVSGYAQDIVRQKVPLENGTTLIFKPISPFELLRTLRIVLDNKK